MRNKYVRTNGDATGGISVQSTRKHSETYIHKNYDNNNYYMCVFARFNNNNDNDNSIVINLHYGRFWNKLWIF